MYRNTNGDLRPSVSAFVMVARKSFTTNLLQKLYLYQTFYVTIVDAVIGRVRFLHTLFDRYLDHMLVKIFEQNRIVRKTS